MQPVGTGGSEVREAIMEGLTAGEEEGRREREGEEKGVTDMVKVSSSLNFFELRLFKDEPPLVSIEKFTKQYIYSNIHVLKSSTQHC